MTILSRRDFVRIASIAAAGTAVAPLGLLNARRAAAAAGKCMPSSFAVDGFGPLSPRVPLNTADLDEVAGVGDLRKVPLLRLPAGFQYTAISIRGQRMSDGNLVPGNHDGMGCFAGPNGTYVLVRNHELKIREKQAGSRAGCLTANGKRYDPFARRGAGLGGGGTSTLVVDRNGKLVQDYVSLGGTIRNCAGGATPWGSWISCEETTITPATDRMATKKHGYAFEVPSGLGEAVDPVPLVAMGRMRHEAVSFDPDDGALYETEDREDSAFYRFVPRTRPNAYGDLQKGGDLYALAIDPNQRSACDGNALPTTRVRGATVVDTRGKKKGAGSLLPFLGQPLKASWVRLEDVDPVRDTLRDEAHAKGAALFWRGEGATHRRGKHYFVCTYAGDAAEGQVWSYDPRRQTVTLVVESTDESLLDGPDNITVAGDGTIYLCEDGHRGRPGDPFYSQYVVGVDPAGGLFQIAHNVIPKDASEFAGVCFPPDGRLMFVNSYGIGITYAISRTDGRPIRVG